MNGLLSQIVLSNYNDDKLKKALRNDLIQYRESAYSNHRDNIFSEYANQLKERIFKLKLTDKVKLAEEYTQLRLKLEVLEELLFFERDLELLLTETEPESSAIDRYDPYNYDSK